MDEGYDVEVLSGRLPTTTSGTTAMLPKRPLNHEYPVPLKTHPQPGSATYYS
jgi:hypothetical protein